MQSRAAVVSLLSVLALASCGERSAAPASPSSDASGKAVAPPSAPTQAAPNARASPADLPTASVQAQGASERDVLIAPTRDLGGALPLKHGIFVSADISCSDPPNAALRRYDGEGLSGAHTHACRIRVLAKHGSSYDVEQSCIDAGQGPGPRSSEKATIDIQDNLTFTLRRSGAVEAFRYCSASMLPPALRDW